MKRLIRKILRFILRPQFERILRIAPETKPEVYLQVFDGADVQNTNYWLELFLSAGIATFGLVLNSPAVVIGAMLVSPLMGPIIGAGLAFAAADLYLGIKSMLQLALSIFGSILFAGFVVWVLPLDAPTSEILARTHPNLLDLGVALFSGLAGSLLLARSKSPGGGGVAALPGVAIAVALMPPLCTVGFGLGVGFDAEIMGGAGLLFLTNLAAIIASAFFVFSLLKMDGPEVSLAIAAPLLERASKDSIYHYLEKKTAISRSFENIGKLRWRVLMLIITLGVVLVPLSNALSQLAQELVARDAVQKAVRLVSPSDENIISQQSNVLSETITVQLIVADPVDNEKVSEAEDLIQQRTGRPARLSVRRVAGVEELVRLQEGILAQRTQAPQSLEEIRAEAVARIQRPLGDLWPSERAQLLRFEIGFTPAQVIVRLSYRSDEPLGEGVREVLSRGIQSELGVERVLLLMEQEQPEASPESEPSAKPVAGPTVGPATSTVRR